MIQYKSSIPEIRLKKIPSDFKKVKITCSNDAQSYARQFYFDDIELWESFFIIILNNANNTIGWAKISQGGISSTIVDPRIIGKLAIDSLATNIIMIHNHPSGNLVPSDSDIKLTEKVKNALGLFDISLLDHIILSNENFYSFADKCKL